MNAFFRVMTEENGRGYFLPGVPVLAYEGYNRFYPMKWQFE